jgi:hypothetical protein
MQMISARKEKAEPGKDPAMKRTVAKDERHRSAATRSV